MERFARRLRNRFVVRHGAFTVKLDRRQREPVRRLSLCLFRLFQRC